MKNLVSLFSTSILFLGLSVANGANTPAQSQINSQPSLQAPLQSSIPFGRNLVRCTALLGGLLAFEFIPDYAGSVTSVKIIAPDLSHTVQVTDSWILQPSELDTTFPLLKSEKPYVQLFSEMKAYKAKNHSFRWETFVWGAKDSRTGEEFGILLHKQNNVVTPIRFGNCKSI